MLAILHQPLGPILDARKVVVVEAAQALQRRETQSPDAH